MPHITKIIGNEPGIQYQGTQDKTGTTGAAPINNMIVGSFKRGRLDRPMTITKSNIRGLLGYDPKNLDYVAVQDALDTGIPSIQVLRLHTSDCDCEDDFFIYPNIYSLTTPMEYGSVIYTLKVNDDIYQAIASSTVSTSILEGFNTIWADEVIVIGSNLVNDLSYYVSSENNGQLYLENLTPDCMKLSLTAGVVLQANTTGRLTDPVTETRILINSLALCGHVVRPE
jgi:hypothetical protein